ncbi:hypothetical protein SERLA73DRAFT_130863 [Serpula lacrymans var. lacrymans S7.3]|uniref:Uncharacterized protein n=2 Tax=Serpula lacrymans var. lacrymans TaxID=341189 RepID=F8PLM5_SERL3|nr:uncharacterized protein SERLADRAFT_379881 [Serpula lacrymans var. lacrymans S7.9]EGO02507.1 hypothetical protein SERLA73DRAFT_130863 [Serpula lacrymans var. lacrymans S7.3]EGO28243.1 hypothetical protein SERLADRAFT_379881 [Serpula lacrymans var. lacrymans S7.9]
MDMSDGDAVMENRASESEQEARRGTTVADTEINIRTSTVPSRDSFRDIQVKVHIRRPERDSWVYLGRALVSQEVIGQSSRVVIRSVTSGKIMVVFGEISDLQAEKRGNFVVVGCVEGSRVVSWSLNALNNSETLRLLASIELACYKCKQALVDPRMHSKARRRIERVIKEDRRRRHRRRKDQEDMVDAFSRQNLEEAREVII